MKRISLLLVVALSMGFWGCDREIVEPFDERTAIEVAEFPEGEYNAGANRWIRIAYPEAMSDTQAGAEPGVIVEMFLRVSRVDWVDASCGPSVHWKVQGHEAFERAMAFYLGFPIRSEEDLDAYLSDAIPPRFIEPGEPIVPPAPGTLGRHRVQTYMWPYVPPDVEDELRATGRDDVLMSLNEFYERTRGLPMTIEVQRLDEAGPSMALVEYMRDFIDQSTREYLEAHRPQCLRD